MQNALAYCAIPSGGPLLSPEAAARALRRAEDDRQLEALRERVLAGDVRAYPALLRLWGGLVVGLARRVARDPDEAEDLAQEVYIKLTRELPRWRATGSLRAWTTRIAVNQARDYLRSKSCRDRRRELPTEAPYLERGPGRAAWSPEKAALAADALATLRRAADALPPKERAAFTSFYFEHRTVAETADALGLTGGHVKVLLFRGRQRLMARPEVAALRE